MKSKMLILCLFMSAYGFSQTNLFQKGDRVCFVGNSITNNGEFYKNILLYYVTRFPERPVTFFNCGISGDMCNNVLQRMDKDILSHQPTHAIIMLGMNDVNRGLYTVYPTTNADTITKREAAVMKYKVQLDSIVNIFLKKKVKVSLQKPTIYDQTAVSKRENNFGVNDVLKRCADYIQTLADKYKLPIVDYWTILNNVNNELQKKDSTATIIGADRIHPGPSGHLIMAYEFLKTTQAPQYVSEIVIENDAKTSNKKSKNCTVSDFTNDKNVISFKIKENALPFPTNKANFQATRLIPFIDELSVEKFVIKNVGNTNQLRIDTALIGTFTKEQLVSGINLNLFLNSPQYKQSLAVSSALDKMWRVVADLRTIGFVEYRYLADYTGDWNNMDQKKAFLDNFVKTRLSSNPYYQYQFDRYYIVKPKQEQLESDFEMYRKEAYIIAQPIVHRFEITKID